MRINDGEVAQLAEAVVTALVKQGFVHPIANEKVLAARIGKLIVDTARAEQEIEEEAERLAAKHARQTSGMDQRKIVQGIKERLAKEKGFPL